jgi:hypothetical protein
MLLVLPASRFREVIPNSLLADPKHMHWYLVPTQRIANPLLDFCTIRLLCAVFEAQNRADNLAIPVIGQTDDTDFGNGWVLEESFFDLGGKYVLTT